MAFFHILYVYMDRKKTMNDLITINQKLRTINLVYAVEYIDSEDQYDPNFYIYNTIFRNVPESWSKRFNDKNFKEKIKTFCDKNYKEKAVNFTGHSKVEVIDGTDYYETYEDQFGDVAQGDNSLFNDYGQLVNGRQFFKYDFDTKLTNKYDYKNKRKGVQ